MRILTTEEAAIATMHRRYSFQEAQPDPHMLLEEISAIGAPTEPCIAEIAEAGGVGSYRWHYDGIPAAAAVGRWSRRGQGCGGGSGAVSLRGRTRYSRIYGFPCLLTCSIRLMQISSCRTAAEFRVEESVLRKNLQLFWLVA